MTFYLIFDLCTARVLNYDTTHNLGLFLFSQKHIHYSDDILMALTEFVEVHYDMMCVYQSSTWLEIKMFCNF